MGDARRERILDWNLERLWWMRKTIDCEVVVAEDDSSNEQFNRSQAINRGVSQVKYPNVAIVDSDTIFSMSTVRAGIRALGYHWWVIPYDLYLRTDQASADRILIRHHSLHLFKSDYTYTHEFPHPPTQYMSPVSGLVMCRTQDFLQIDGFDERFQGWGWEDRAWVVKADHEIGPHGRLDGEVYHLWHQEPPETTEQQPNIEANKKLYEEVCNAYVQ